MATILLKFSDGSWVETTNEHPFHVDGRGFVTAEKLETSDRLSQDDGEHKLIASITPLQRASPVYNLEVVGSHTYFVGAGEDFVWVHNKCKLAGYPFAEGPGIYMGTGIDGKPYIGGTMNGFNRIGPGHHALDLNHPVGFFPMPGKKRNQVRAAEQELINLIGGGDLNSLTNKRNAIAKKNWTRFGVRPPRHLD